MCDLKFRLKEKVVNAFDLQVGSLYSFFSFLFFFIFLWCMFLASRYLLIYSWDNYMKMWLTCYLSNFYVTIFFLCFCISSFMNYIYRILYILWRIPPPIWRVDKQKGRMIKKIYRTFYSYTWILHNPLKVFLQKLFNTHDAYHIIGIQYLIN